MSLRRSKGRDRSHPWLRWAAFASIVSCVSGQRAGPSSRPIGVAARPSEAPLDLAPSGAPSASAGASAVPPSIGEPASNARTSGIALQGYIGKHSVRAVLERQQAAWRGGLRFIGRERTLEGTVEADEIPEPMSGLSFGRCTFTERDERGVVTAWIEASCSVSDTWLTVDGTSTDTRGATEPVFLCGITGDARGFERYERALLTTPRPAHGCPPIVRVDQVIPRPGAPTWVLYRLGWVCEAQWPSPVAAGEVLVPLDDEPYRALIDESDPTKLVDVGILARDIQQEESVSLQLLPWSVGVGALRLEVTQRWASLASGAGSDARNVLWLTSGSDRAGPMLLLPGSSYSGCCVCQRDGESVELFRVPLDGDEADDLLVRKTHTSSTFGPPGANGSPHCVIGPEKVEYAAYRSDSAWLRLTPVTTPPPARIRALLERADRIQ